MVLQSSDITLTGTFRFNHRRDVRVTKYIAVFVMILQPLSKDTFGISRISNLHIRMPLSTSKEGRLPHLEPVQIYWKQDRRHQANFSARAFYAMENAYLKKPGEIFSTLRAASDTRFAAGFLQKLLDTEFASSIGTRVTVQNMFVKGMQLSPYGDRLRRVIFKREKAN